MSALKDSNWNLSAPGFEIIHESGPLLAVSKPNGLLTQAPPDIDSLEQRIKSYLKIRDAKTGRVYLGVPHRLDRPASGVMVFAKHARAARRLAEQFEGRTVQKTYWALVEGRLEHDSGTWRDFVRKVPGEARAEVVPADASDAREAVLHYHVLHVGDSYSWLEIQLETGRTHQIRIQAAHRGCPIMGDFQYGANQEFGPSCDSPRDRWIALHARHLSLRHPMSRERMTIEAPPPSPWRKVTERSRTGQDQ